MTPFAFLLIGLFLIYLEFYVPGAVMGIAGGLLVAASIFLAIITYSSTVGILVFVLLAIFGVVGVIKFALWRIPRASPGRTIYSAADQEGYQASSFDKSAIGKKGVVFSDLKPGGYILIEGQQHQAISESGYLKQGTPIIVLKGDGESLIVKEDV